MKSGHSESERMKKHVLDDVEMKGLRKILLVSRTAKKTNEWVLNQAGVEVTVRHRQSKEASILWQHHEERSEK